MSTIDGSARQPYTYTSKQVGAYVFAIPCAALTGVFALVSLIWPTNLGMLQVAIFSIPFLFALFVIYRNYSLHRPLLLSEAGLAAQLIGRKQNLILWSDIVRIEEQRRYDPSVIKERYFFRVIGNKKTICFDDWIKNISQLISNMNTQIYKHNIEVIYIDFGRDTLASAIAMTSDRNERRRIAREGIRGTVPRLILQPFNQRNPGLDLG